MPDFEWDRTKAVANLNEHDVSFEEAALLWESPVVVDVSSPRRLVTEDRHIRIGSVAEGRVLAVVYVMRGSTVRLISARHASRQERRRYAEEKQEYSDGQVDESS